MTEPLAWAMVIGALLALSFALFALWRSSTALLGAEAADPLPEEGVESWLERLDEARARLLERKRVVLRGLRDVRAERAAGRIDSEEADALEARLKRRYVEVVEALQAQLGECLTEAERLLREAVEGSLPEASEPPEVSEGKAVAGASVVRAEERANGATRCMACDSPNDADARFCKRCGRPMEGSPPEEDERAEDVEGAEGADPSPQPSGEADVGAEEASA